MDLRTCRFLEVLRCSEAQKRGLLELAGPGGVGGQPATAAMVRRINRGALPLGQAPCRARGVRRQRAARHGASAGQAPATKTPLQMMD